MFKKIWCALLIAGFLICFSVPVFAGPDGEDTISPTGAENVDVIPTVQTGSEVADTLNLGNENTIDTPEGNVSEDGSTDESDTLDETADVTAADESVESGIANEGELSGNETTYTDEAAEQEKETTQNFIDKLVYDPNLEETEQFLVTITTPRNSSEFAKSSNNYGICGGVNKDLEDDVVEDIQVVLARLNEKTEKYEYFEDVEGNSSWEIKASGVFTKYFDLEEGTNQLKIMAYKRSEADTLVPGENFQVNYYTIKVLKSTTQETNISNNMGLIGPAKELLDDITTNLNKNDTTN